MARPIKWSRDLHAIRERATRSRTETWSRQEIERLFGIGRASAQNLMKAIGEVQPVGGAHFVSRASLLDFLSAMAAAESVEAALRQRLDQAAPVPRPSALQVSLPEGLRRITLPALPANIHIAPGEIRITGAGAEEVVEGLLVLATVLQNDLDAVRTRLEPPPSAAPAEIDEGLRLLLDSLRSLPA